MKDHLKQLEKKLFILEQEVNKMEDILESVKNEKELQSPLFEVLTYFSYTILLPNSNRTNGLILGSFIIKNLSKQKINNPLICLKITPKHATLSGKIDETNDKNTQDYDRRLNPLTLETWEYIDKDMKKKAEEDGEYWIRPKNIKVIEPEKLISFSNFQIVLPNEENSLHYNMNGFFYSTEHPKGIKSLNKIIVYN